MRKVIFCCFCCWIVLMACSSPEQEQVAIPLPSDSDKIESESFNVTYFYSDSARVTAKLEAQHVIEKMEPSEEEESEEIKLHYFDQGIFIRFFNILGQTTSTVKANSAVLDQEAGIAELKGNVILDNLNSGDKLETEQLFWNQEKDSIYVERDEFIRITTTEQVITGKGLRTNTSFEPYFIYNVSGQFTIQDGNY